MFLIWEVRATFYFPSLHPCEGRSLFIGALCILGPCDCVNLGACVEPQPLALKPGGGEISKAQEVMARIGSRGRISPC